MKRLIKRIISAFRIYNIRLYILMKFKGGVISFYPKILNRGRILLSYMTLPFINKTEDILNGHTNVWECRDIVNSFLEEGYIVDVIDWKNNKFIPKTKYDYIIDIHSNLERLAPYLNKDCKKIFHATIPHWLTQNYAEYSRLIDIKRRRSVILLPRRQEIPTNSIEYADIITLLGNLTTEQTYHYAKKRIVHIPLSTTHKFPSPENKDFEGTRNKFMWIGGSGMVRKGLDLVLEAFSKMPEYELYICGKVINDTDFNEVYHHELYESKNIHTLGHVDPGGPIFEKIRSDCLALVYPTATEGQAGSVIVSLHAGMIPIISEYAGVNIDGFGIMLKKNTVEEICLAVKNIASRPIDQLREYAINAWKYAQQNHSREKFASEYRKFVKDLIGNKLI